MSSSESPNAPPFGSLYRDGCDGCVIWPLPSLFCDRQQRCCQLLLKLKQEFHSRPIGRKPLFPITPVHRPIQLFRVDPVSSRPHKVSCYKVFITAINASGTVPSVNRNSIIYH